MKEPKFEYGPIAKGVFIALAWGTFLFLAFYPEWLAAYLALLVFLAFGLRPFLERSGIYYAYISLRFRMSEKLNRKWVEKRRKALEAAERSKRLKYRHEKDPKLPKNW